MLVARGASRLLNDAPCMLFAFDANSWKHGLRLCTCYTVNLKKIGFGGSEGVGEVQLFTIILKTANVISSVHIFLSIFHEYIEF